MGVVYALYLNGTCTYVGSTRNLRGRLGSHRSRNRKFDSNAVVETCEDADLLARERYWIETLRPTENKLMPSVNPAERNTVNRTFNFSDEDERLIKTIQNKLTAIYGKTSVIQVIRHALIQTASTK